MLDRLEAIKARFDQLGVALTNPAIVVIINDLLKRVKNIAALRKIVIAYEEYKKVLDDVTMYREALNGTMKN
jgi:peptide chain release factor 1